MSEQKIELIWSEWANFETRRFGAFGIAAFKEKDSNLEHVCLAKGLHEESGVTPLVRISSECVTGCVLDAMNCDCRDQNDLALFQIAERGKGAFILLRQEGRGHGLFRKIEAMRYKESGLDTFSAVEQLDLPADVRSYEAAAFALMTLGLLDFDLLSANPGKAEALRSRGLKILAMLPIWIERPELAIHNSAKLTRGFLKHATTDSA